MRNGELNLALITHTVRGLTFDTWLHHLFLAFFFSSSYWDVMMMIEGRGGESEKGITGWLSVSLQSEYVEAEEDETLLYVWVCPKRHTTSHVPNEWMPLCESFFNQLIQNGAQGLRRGDYSIIIIFMMKYVMLLLPPERTLLPQMPLCVCMDHPSKRLKPIDLESWRKERCGNIGDSIFISMDFFNPWSLQCFCICLNRL